MASGLVKKKYPKLIGKTPAQQFKGLDILPDNICQKRNKVCQPRSGGCGYRFKKGDKSWVCPLCGQNRQCISKKISGGKACRMHGGAAGRPPTTMKYMAPQIILDNYNKILSDPDLLTMSHEISLLSSHTQQLFILLDEQNVLLANQMIRKAATLIEKGVFDLNMMEIRQGLQLLFSALDPLNMYLMAWTEIKDNFKVQASLAKLQNEWLQEKDEMIPRKHLLEVLIWINRISLKYIRDPNDRKAYGREVKSLLPKKKR